MYCMTLPGFPNSGVKSKGASAQAYVKYENVSNFVIIIPALCLHFAFDLYSFSLLRHPMKVHGPQYVTQTTNNQHPHNWCMHRQGNTFRPVRHIFLHHFLWHCAASMCINQDYWGISQRLSAQLGSIHKWRLHNFWYSPFNQHFMQQPISTVCPQN